MSARDALQRSPRLSLSLLFVAWKLLIVLIALLSPGSGYDTSTTILYSDRTDWTVPFVRWDAFYFTKIAQRGYLFEQDWAFSWGLTSLLHILARYLSVDNVTIDLPVVAWLGIAVSHLGHFVAVHALYSLASRLLRTSKAPASIAHAAACLHIVSPAGIFLSAPYAESLFAALQLLGYNAYSIAWLDCGSKSLRQASWLLASGTFFGFAMLLRSNGILSGLLFAYDAVPLLVLFVTGRGTSRTLLCLVATVLAGSCVAVGAAFPQILAYREYCSTVTSHSELRPWCLRRMPSIYTYVQARYWNVGFLKYWTLSNIPSFLIAAPTIWLLARSCYWPWAAAFSTMPHEPSIWTRTFHSLTRRRLKHNNKSHKRKEQWSFNSVKPPTEVLQQIAIPQAALIALTLLNSHVQIITRLASGYPLWYMWLAFAVHISPPGTQPHRLATYFIRWMVLYALIQGVLFASFLPPA